LSDDDKNDKNSPKEGFWVYFEDPFDTIYAHNVEFRWSLALILYYI